jgi:glycosyltransferase involved in cell wall biosynthesis
MSDKVSIITPSFNRASIIHETAESIFRQTYSDWEWVIVDDGSSDDSWNVINKYAAEDLRVKVFKRDRDPKGACTCRNIAVEKCTGDFLIFLDTDDLLAAFCIEQRLKAFLNSPGLDFMVFPMLMFRNKPDDLKLLWNVDSEINDIDRILIGDPICQGTGTIWKKSSFIKIGMWDERLYLWQDIQLHLRSIIFGLKFGKRMDLKPDVFIRISDISLSRTGFNTSLKLKSRYVVFEETITELHRQKKVEIHCLALKEMLIGIFNSSLNIKAFDISDQLLSTSIKLNLLSRKEVKLLKLNMFIYKVRLSKIYVLRSFFSIKLKKIGFQGEYFLNKVSYNQNIEW